MSDALGPGGSMPQPAAEVDDLLRWAMAGVRAELSEQLAKNPVYSGKLSVEIEVVKGVVCADIQAVRTKRRYIPPHETKAIRKRGA